MGKSVVRRLAEYLRDLWVTNEGNAPEENGEAGWEKGAPSAGGEEPAGWDGAERRKLRAVIGIPYSSDNAEDEDPDPEEKPGKRMEAL